MTKNHPKRSTASHPSDAHSFSDAIIILPTSMTLLVTIGVGQCLGFYVQYLPIKLSKSKQIDSLRVTILYNIMFHVQQVLSVDKYALLLNWFVWSLGLYVGIELITCKLKLFFYKIEHFFRF